MFAYLAKHLVALHIAFLAAFLAWTRGGTTQDHIWPIPWLVLGLIEAMWLVPPQRQGETVGMARSRMGRGILRDPATYLGVALVVFLAIQWLNGPRHLEFDVETGVWSYTAPPWPNFPFCVNRGDALQVLRWGLAAAVVTVAVRHALPRASKLLLLRLLVANAAALALVGLLQAATGTHRILWVGRHVDVQFFSTFGYPNNAGTYFAMALVLGTGLLLQALSAEGMAQRRHAGWLGAATVLNLLGATFSLSRAAIVLAWGWVIVGGVYALFFLRPYLRPAHYLRIGAAVLVVVVVLSVVFVLPASHNPLRRELSTINLLHLQDQFAGDRRQLAQAAIRIWQDYPWCGVGAWGFRRYVALYIGEANWSFLQVAGRANVHNDPIQYLCEHGIVGAGLILALCIVLAATLQIRLIGFAIRGTAPDEDVPRSLPMRIPPLVVCLVAATLLAVIHSLVDLPFRSVAIVVFWFVALAAAPAFVPRKTGGAAPASPSAAD